MATAVSEVQGQAAQICVVTAVSSLNCQALREKTT